MRMAQCLGFPVGEPFCLTPPSSDFRARDRAAGGQGAPLVPFADECLLHRPDRVTGALNLGGIANITIVHPRAPPQAFDTGPANMLIDGALARATGGELSFDEGGHLGMAGVVDRAWLQDALAAVRSLQPHVPQRTLFVGLGRSVVQAD